MVQYGGAKYNSKAGEAPERSATFLKPNTTMKIPKRHDSSIEFVRFDMETRKRVYIAKSKSAAYTFAAWIRRWSEFKFDGRNWIIEVS
jgi:hypothetical protein